jgi:hypothetical protein
MGGLMSSSVLSPVVISEVAASRSVERRSVSRASCLLHLFPSLTDVAFLLPVLLVLRFGGLSFLLGDGDTGWHLKAGEWMLQNHRVPMTDLFSFTKSGQPWFAWEWLWDVAFARLHMAFGMNGVALASLLLICLAAALTYRIALRACANPVIAAAVATVGIVASSIHWLARPHLVTLVFVPVFFLLLEKARSGRMRMLFLLPLVMIPWANLHGGFVAGILMLGAYAGGELCAWMFEPDRTARRAALANFAKYLFALAGCAVASLVNPYGYRVHVHIFRYLNDQTLLQNTSEFQALNFHHPAAALFGVLLLMGSAGMFWHLTRKRYAWVLLVGGWSWLALTATRNFPIFVICAAAPIALASKEIVEALSGAPVASWVKRAVRSFDGFSSEIATLETPWRTHLLSVAAFVLLASLAAGVAAPDALQARYSEDNYPVRVVDEVLAKAAPGRILTTDAWAGYLIYRMFPSIRVFFDGRGDFYGGAFGNQWRSILNAEYGWEAQLTHFGVDTVLLPVRAPLVGALKESHNWTPVYDDGAAILFRSINQNSSQVSTLPRSADAGVAARLRQPQPINP